MDDIERKINTGLDRSLTAIITWAKLFLQAEQKKTDFKPETDDFDTVASAVSGEGCCFVCAKPVCGFLGLQYGLSVREDHHQRNTIEFRWE